VSGQPSRPGPRVRIVSEHPAAELARIYVDDVQLTNVTKITWTAEAGRYTRATLELVDVELDAQQADVIALLQTPGAPPEPAIVELAELARVQVRPGDVFIVTVPAEISMDEAARLREWFTGWVPGHDVGVLFGGVKASLIRREHLGDLDEHTAAALDAGE
jgi:hypothetical protein